MTGPDRLKPSAVSFYPLDHPALNITAKQRIAKLRQQLREELELASDWSDQRYRVGMIRGLELALNEIEAVFEELTHA
jgi:hypothetical protein